jgi:hypothetical protein
MTKTKLFRNGRRQAEEPLSGDNVRFAGSANRVLIEPISMQAAGDEIKGVFSAFRMTATFARKPRAGCWLAGWAG